VERDPKRLDRMRENLARLHLRATLVQADAASWRPAAPFDAILLDAPCSATGIIRRHPDIPHLKRPRDIPALVQQQDRLLDAAASLLRPGGRLVYAVCSLQREEGPERVIAAAARTALRLDPFTVSEVGMLPEARTQEGWLRTHPAMWPERGGMDGFFAARLIRS
jgi:16S rRNA (cytosine967-C5)-methyltransferase